MNRIAVGLAVGLAVVLAGPAAATSALQFQKVALNNTTDVGTSFRVNFQAVSDGGGGGAQQYSNISGSAEYKLLSVGFSGTGNNIVSTWRFLATLTNTSTAPMTDARISTFGFSTAAANATGNNPTFLPISSAAVVGNPLFESVLFNNSGGLNIPNVSGSNDPQLCFKDGGNNNNCGGGAGGGLQMRTLPGNPFPNTSTEFTLAFTGSSNLTALTLHNFYLRFQSLTGTGNKVGGGTGSFNGGSGVAIVTEYIDPVPEPTSWAMLITGFGLVGAAARRRRAVAA